MTDRGVAFCIEQTLGHRAHATNIRRALAAEPGVAVHEIPYGTPPRFAPVPWAVRASRAANTVLTRHSSDIAFLHTQSVSLFAPSLRRKGQPYLVSVDATPIQLDTMGAYYRHRRQAALLEQAKRSWYRRVFRGASGVVAWSNWAAASLQQDYDVEAERISVVHPGATERFFEIDRKWRQPGPLRVLFVGGDFVRKGGPQLLEATNALADRVRLTILTESDVPPRPRVNVVRGLTPASPGLIAAFAQADVFCLPTLADCTPVVLAEAMAAALPIVTTDVGSNSSLVTEGENGFTVPPADVAQLTEALRTLADDPSLRRTMGQQSRAIARDSLHADDNARFLLRLARRCA